MNIFVAPASINSCNESITRNDKPQNDKTQNDKSEKIFFNLIENVSSLSRNISSDTKKENALDENEKHSDNEDYNSIMPVCITTSKDNSIIALDSKQITEDASNTIPIETNNNDEMIDTNINTLENGICINTESDDIKETISEDTKLYPDLLNSNTEENIKKIDMEATVNTSIDEDIVELQAKQIEIIEDDKAYLKPESIAHIKQEAVIVNKGNNVNEHVSIEVSNEKSSLAAVQIMSKEDDADNSTKDNKDSMENKRNNFSELFGIKNQPIDAAIFNNEINNSESRYFVSDALNLSNVQADDIVVNDVKNEAIQEFKIAEQIISKGFVLLDGEKSEITLTLEPEYLGKITLSVVNEKGVVNAKFIAENIQVKNIIEASFELLKTSLEKQGMSVQSFDVSVKDERRQSDFGSNPRNKQKSSNSKSVRGNYQLSNETGLDIAKNPYRSNINGEIDLIA